VTVEQDPDQSPEVCGSACADEGKPQFNHLTHVFTLKLLNFLYSYFMCIYVQELN
jgi:hypothetical protein